MKKLSKILSVGLSLVMCASMVAPAFAASFTELQGAINTGNSVYQEDGKTYKIEASKDDETGAVNIKLHEEVTNAEDKRTTILVEKDVTIDLNGNKIVDERAQNGAIRVYKNGSNPSLTVEDSSEGKTGLIEGNGATVINNQNGTLNLNGGTVKATSATGTAVSAGVTTTISKDVTVEGGQVGVKVGVGGTLETEGIIRGQTHSGIWGNGANASITVSGGSVTGPAGIQLDNGAKATIDGKATTIEGNGKNGSGIFIRKNAQLTINDGKIQGTSYGISGNGEQNWYDGSNVTILGGEVIGGYTGIYQPQDGKLTIGNEKDGTGPIIIGQKGVGVQLCAGEGVIYGGTIRGSGEDRTEGKTGDGTIPDGAAVSLVSRAGYGPNFNLNEYSEPKITIHIDHVTLIGGEATYQWYNKNDPGQKPDNWTGNEETSGVFYKYHTETAEIDPYVAPTYTSIGWTEGSHCYVCGRVIVPQEPIPMLTMPGTGSPNPGTVIPDGNVPMGELPEADTGIEIEDEAVPLAGLFTRADAIGYLWEQSGSPEWELSDFEDVPEDHYWAVAIGWAQDMGIAVADEDGNFRPDDLVLRFVEDLEIDPEGEFEEFLNRYAVYAGIELDEGELFIELGGEWDDIVMGEEAQVIFDNFFTKLEEALADLAA